MTLAAFLQQLRENPQQIDFAQTLAVIDAHYEFTPTAFRNGDLMNDAGQNSGSCRVLAFAQERGLSVDETLACFGDYYRKDVLQHPDGQDHQNIRNFMRNGWEGVAFSDTPLRHRR